MVIKVISFDLDGTIVDFNFNQAFFEEAVPHLYSQKYKMPIRKAKKIILSELKTFGSQDIRFYKPAILFKKLGLENNSAVIKDLEHHIGTYPDSIPVLRGLSKRFKLIIISSSVKSFIRMKLESEDIRKYISKSYSTIDMFNDLKSPLVYKAVLKDMRIKKENMVHVGDDPIFDYLIPRKLGITAFLLKRGDRRRIFDHGRNPVRVPKRHVVKDLRELVKKIEELGT